jgi:hypothetical protein
VHHPVSHDARFQICPEQLEHLLVMHPSCEPRHQHVVLNPIKERLQVQIDTPRRVISNELACPLDRTMRRAPRPETEAMGMEMRVKDRREHLR